MVWSIEFSETARRQIKRLDRRWQEELLEYLEKEIAVLEDPRSRGKALVGDKQGLWRYRVGDYRIIFDIRDRAFVIVAVVIGHRRDIYR